MSCHDSIFCVGLNASPVCFRRLPALARNGVLDTFLRERLPRIIYTEWTHGEMGLVRIRHGVAQHAMKSRVRAYKNRAKGSGWQANWREHFSHSLTLKTSVFPLSIRLLFGPIKSPTIKKSTSVADLDSNQEVGGGAKASGCRMLEW